MQSVVTGNGFLGTDIDDNLKGYLSLRENGAVFKTIGTASIGDGRAVSICDAAVGDGLAVSIGYFFHNFLRHQW